MNKQEIRKTVKLQKRELTREYVREYSEAVSKIFLAQRFYLDATIIYPYLAYNTEILTNLIIEQAWRDGKRVAVPKVLADGVMDFYYIDDFSSIENGYCDIPEPITTDLQIADEKNALIIMPGLAFDESHNRIGYGGGFYDRYLEKQKATGNKLTKVSLAYDFQIFDRLETEIFDEKVDHIITRDRGVF